MTDPVRAHLSFQPLKTFYSPHSFIFGTVIIIIGREHLSRVERASSSTPSLVIRISTSLSPDVQFSGFVGLLSVGFNAFEGVSLFHIDKSHPTSFIVDTIGGRNNSVCSDKDCIEFVTKAQ